MSGDRPTRVARIVRWLEDNAAWIDAARNVQLVFDCAGPEVKVRTGVAERLAAETDDGGLRM